MSAYATVDLTHLPFGKMTSAVALSWSSGASSTTPERWDITDCCQATASRATVARPSTTRRESNAAAADGGGGIACWRRTKVISSAKHVDGVGSYATVHQVTHDRLPWTLTITLNCIVFRNDVFRSSDTGKPWKTALTTTKSQVHTRVREHWPKTESPLRAFSFAPVRRWYVVSADPHVAAYDDASRFQDSDNTD